MTLQVRYRSTGQEWSRWEKDKPADPDMKALVNGATNWLKITILTDYGQKIQWRRKP